jgi:hypothetical protein
VPIGINEAFYFRHLASSSSELQPSDRAFLVLVNYYQIARGLTS